MNVTLHELEQAINFWRQRHPSSRQALKLCAEAAALAEPYAEMILRRQSELPLASLSEPALAAFETWRRAGALGLEPGEDR